MKNYPEIIPVFPLNGVIYFPKTNLPLNIFEQRYLDLVNDAYNKDKLMGMVQSKKENDTHIAIFNGKAIRRKLVNDKWFFSVVDIVRVLTESDNPRNYWSMLKQREKESGRS